MKIAAIVYILGGVLVAGYGMRFAGVNTVRLLVLVAAGFYLVFRGVNMMKRR